MTQRIFVSLGAIVVIGIAGILMLAPVAVTTAGAQSAGRYDPPRTAWGHPDLQGIWTSNAVMGVPVEQAKETLTAEDVARRDRAEALRNEQEPNRDVNIVWDEPETERKIQQPSLVVDPPNDGFRSQPRCRRRWTIGAPPTTASGSTHGRIWTSGIDVSRRGSRR